jgi:hypothetical protein
MKKSNKIIISAGITLAVLLLATVITARVLFDNTLVVRQPGNGEITVETRF